MFTERVHRQNDTAVVHNREENTQHRGHDQEVALKKDGDLKVSSTPDENLAIPAKVTPVTGDRIYSQRKSTRISQGGRVLRNHRYRRMFDENRHTKRLFTPEIKKYLKDWLIRRRDHPYPNRDEKKSLAIQTGLTYIQICNWFANWRRKLKNAGNEDQRTWSHLIKSYNTQAEGNVEHFSICSDDSIWDRKEFIDSGDLEDEEDDSNDAAHSPEMKVSTAMDHCYSVLYHGNNLSSGTTTEAGLPKVFSAPVASGEAQCFTVSSTTTEDEESLVVRSKGSHQGMQRLPKEPLDYRLIGKSKYKTHIMEKYMNHLKLDSTEMEVTKPSSKTNNSLKRKYIKEGTGIGFNSNRNSAEFVGWDDKQSKFHENKPFDAKSKSGSSGKRAKSYPPKTKLLSKWVESAANFQPTKSYVSWTNSTAKTEVWPKKTSKVESSGQIPMMGKEYWAARGHQREELDAAEALTCLSGLH